MTQHSKNLMLFYKSVKALSSEQHKNWVLHPAKTLEFAANTHWVPVVASEFASLSKNLAVIFVRENQDDDSIINPIVLLGLTVGHNDILNADMTWNNDYYIPAFIRRYPFLPAAPAPDSEQLTICIDEAAPHFSQSKEDSDNNEQALFTPEGKPTEFLDQMIKFLQDFHHEMQRTKLFVDKLNEYDLLTSRNAEIRNASGSVFQIADMLVVDEERLNKLDADKLKDLATHGMLGWIYAHLLSLNNLPDLFAQHQKQLQKPVAGHA